MTLPSELEFPDRHLLGIKSVFVSETADLKMFQTLFLMQSFLNGNSANKTKWSGKPNNFGHFCQDPFKNREILQSNNICYCLLCVPFKLCHLHVLLTLTSHCLQIIAPQWDSSTIKKS